MSKRYTGSVLEILAHCGYVARGIVYCVIGVFAFLAAVGRGGGVRGSTGALQTLLHQPFGEALVITTAANTSKQMQAIIKKFDPLGSKQRT